MAYRKTYRGEFSNTLPDALNAPVEQVVRVDIADTSSGLIATATLSVAVNTIGFAAAGVVFAAVPGSGGTSSAALIAFFTGALGKMIRISGTTNNDGDYIITTNPVITPDGPLPVPHEAVVSFEVNVVNVAGSTNVSGVIVEDITVGAIVALKMAGDPLHIQTIDNSEDKFTTIRPKQATIKIHTDEVIDINTFAEADDGSLYVEIFVDTLIIFRGYLIIPDMQQEFMPNPNELVLTAVDNLGTLKDILLVDQDDLTPLLNHQIIKYIAWCLRLSNVLQPINVINSVRHGTGAQTMTVTFVYLGDVTVFTAVNSDAAKLHVGEQIVITGSASNNFTVTIIDIQTIDPFIKKIVTNGTFSTEGPVAIGINDSTSLLPFYEAIYLDAKTFEKDINVCQDCYTVLKKILAEDSVLFQQNGEWYVVRIDDVQGDGDYSVDRYDTDGVYIETVSISRNKNIGKPDIMQFMNDDPLIIPDRGYKKITQTWKYDFPIEIVCNIDFGRGDFIADVTPTADEIADGINFASTYNLDDWTMKRGFPTAPIANDSNFYVKRLYKIFSYEVQRFAVLTPPTTVDVRTPYIESCGMDVNKNDRFEMSVSFRLATDPTTGGGFYGIMRVVLHGVDGSWWILGQKPAAAGSVGGESTDAAKWWNTLNWTVFTGKGEVGLNFSGANEPVFTEWQSVEYQFQDFPALPVSGKLYIWLGALNNDAAAYDDVDIYYNALSVTYYPFINGSIKKYTGQSHSVSQAGDFRAARDEEVFISDSPALIFKGTMKYFNGIDYLLSTVFTDANNSTAVPFGQLQAYAVWNQFRKSNRNFDGEVDLMESEVVDGPLYNGADLLHKYKITDTNVNTVNRLFMVLHYDMDFNLLEWKAFIASLYRTDLGKVYTDPHVFKYISS